MKDRLQKVYRFEITIRKYLMTGLNVSPYRSTVIKAILNDVVRTQ